jgi:hypothetical protein
VGGLRKRSPECEGDRGSDLKGRGVLQGHGECSMCTYGRSAWWCYSSFVRSTVLSHSDPKYTAAVPNRTWDSLYMYIDGYQVPAGLNSLRSMSTASTTSAWFSSTLPGPDRSDTIHTYPYASS